MDAFDRHLKTLFLISQIGVLRTMGLYETASIMSKKEIK